MELLRRFRWPISLGLIAVAVLGALLLWKPVPSPPAPVAALIVSTPTPLPTEPLLPSPTPAPLVVYVSGAVLHPGVYTLPVSARVADALAAAGGATADADLVHINLARRVHDEEQVHIPLLGEPTPAISPPVSEDAAPASPGTPGKVNINTASAAELDSLPGIGPGYAERIVAYRQSHGPFRTIEEIQNVPGIGPSTFARIRDLITVQ
jgi:competence protein ComEA